MEQKMTNNHITIGILAHVDAGKTTLSEAMLYSTGLSLLRIVVQICVLMVHAPE